MKRLQSLFAGVAAVSLFAMMLLTFADVFSRKFLGNSITGAVELTELAMLVMIFCALPLASLAGEHIVFDLLDRVLPTRLLRWQRAFAHFVTGAAFGGAAWAVWIRTIRTSNLGDETATLEIRIAPFQQLVAAMLVVAALVHTVQLLQTLRRSAASPTATPNATSRKDRP